MFRLRVKSEFSSAHNLRNYKGKCEELHGHNWKVEVCIAANNKNKQGMILDFHEIKSALENVTEGLDHKYLNQAAYFKKHNPTSENLAEYIFNQMAKLLKSSRYRLEEVIVWESDNCSAAYSKR